MQQRNKASQHRNQVAREPHPAHPRYVRTPVPVVTAVHPRYTRRTRGAPKAGGGGGGSPIASAARAAAEEGDSPPAPHASAGGTEAGGGVNLPTFFGGKSAGGGCKPRVPSRRRPGRRPRGPAVHVRPSLRQGLRPSRRQGLRPSRRPSTCDNRGDDRVRRQPAGMHAALGRGGAQRETASSRRRTHRWAARKVGGGWQPAGAGGLGGRGGRWGTRQMAGTRGLSGRSCRPARRLTSAESWRGRQPAGTNYGLQPATRRWGAAE